jgi:hypothetical protein
MIAAEVSRFTEPNVFSLLKPRGYFTQITNNFNTEKFYIIPTVYLYLLCVSRNKQRIFFILYNAQWLVFITEVASVHCAVRTGSLNMTDYVLYLKGKYDFEKDFMT